MAAGVAVKDVSARLADLLVDAGVTTGFCVQGDGNLDLIAAATASLAAEASC